MSRTMTRNYLSVLATVSLIACIGISIYAYNMHIFTSQAALQTFIAGFGPVGTVVFIIFQAVQVVVPILPGGLGCLAGVLLFGAWKGLLYNYVGICVGSIAAFLIARSCGKPILYSLFKEKTIEKYEKWTGNDSRFATWFALAIFFPVAPDDFLCYLAGTTQICWKKFTAIILLGRPFSISLYSLGLNMILQHALTLLH